MKPKVSLLVSSYNKGNWIEACLISALNQTYRPIEIVVCDNGSTDRSVDVIKSLMVHKEIVAMFYPEPLGITKACNLCIQKASGEWLAFLDADDMILPDHIEGLVSEVVSHPEADMIYGDFISLKEDGLTIVKTNDVQIFDRCSLACFSSIIRKSTMDEIGMFDENMDYSEEWEFIVRLLKKGKVLVRGSRTGYVHREGIGNISSEKFFVNSLERKANHTYMRNKHGLKTPCQCGCGA